jgi:hypothetical protein
MLAQTFRQPFVMMGYYANTAAFAKNCENKAKPRMHCNGKCQAMKKLQEQEKKDQDLPGTRSDDKSEVLSSKSFFPSLPEKQLFINYIKLISPLSTGTIVDQSQDCFHPPQAWV